jgi:hypothetical protein
VAQAGAVLRQTGICGTIRLFAAQHFSCGTACIAAHLLSAAQLNSAAQLLFATQQVIFGIPGIFRIPGIFSTPGIFRHSR